MNVQPLKQINPAAILRNYGFSGKISKGTVYVKGLISLGNRLGLNWSPLAKEIHWKGWIWKDDAGEEKAEREAKLNKMIDDIRAIGAKERKKVIQLVKKYQAKFKESSNCKEAFGEFLNEYAG